MYAVGMTNTTDNTLGESEREILQWVLDAGYTSVEDWAADSDYSELIDGLWVDEHGNEVDPWVQAYYAKEAAGE
jgi:hypothetical protein